MVALHGIQKSLDILILLCHTIATIGAIGTWLCSIGASVAIQIFEIGVSLDGMWRIWA